MEGFVQCLPGGEAAMSTQHDDLIVLQRLGNLVRHLRRTRSKLLGHNGNFLEQVGGFIIDRYQFIVPSTWNAGPRDVGDVPGPYESALIGTPVADP